MHDKPVYKTTGFKKPSVYRQVWFGFTIVKAVIEDIFSQYNCCNNLLKVVGKKFMEELLSGVILN